MELRVHILQEDDEEFLTVLKEKLDPEITLTHGPIAPSPANYHILVAGRFEKEDLTTSPDLHTVVIPWAGLPQTARGLLMELPQLAVHNLHHNAVPTAELAFTLMLAAAKDLIPIDSAFRNNNWTPRYTPSRATTLKDKIALVIGYGTIGQQISGMCEGLQMKVRAIRRGVDSTNSGSVSLHTISELGELLPETYALFISLPFTPDTRGLIGRDELSLLPNDAILVNIARGPIVDEQALYEELSSRRIRAGSDVWYLYPREEGERTDTAPSQYPFHELDNVVMSPHLAGHAKETEQLRAEALADLLNLAAFGSPMSNAIDLKRGY